MDYKIIVLDFDGTIADTKESILITMKFVANKLGYEIPKDADISFLIGLPLKTTFQKVFNIRPNELDLAISEYRTYYNEIAIESVFLFTGVEHTLRKLKENDCILTIASSKGKQALIDILERNKIRDIFSFVAGEQDVKNKKPSPDVVNMILKKYSIKPNNCLVVGDTIYDIEMGQKAFTDTCGVTYGNNTKEELLILRPTYIIEKFTELTNLIL